MHSRLSGTPIYSTLELKVACRKALTSTAGLLRAEGRGVTLGRRVAFSEGTLRDASGLLYASATSTLLVIDH